MTMRASMPFLSLVLATTLLHAQEKPKGPERWESAMKAFEEQDAKASPKKGGVLFIGSSSIRKWNLDDSFPGKEYLNRGFGGSEISDSIHFADRIIFPYAAKTILLYAGDNDIAKGKTAERVVSDFRKFVEVIHAKQPSTKVVFIAIKPSIKRWSLVDQMRDANKQIKAICDKHDLLAFADIDTPMIGDDGKPKPELFVKDGLHLSEAGYEVWTKVIEPQLK